METIFSLVLLTSLYASIVGIVIIILKTILKNIISPKWHYIIWIVLILKLLIPFGPESAVSLFNAIPPVYSTTSFTQAYEQIQQTIIAKPDISNLPQTGSIENTSGIRAIAKTALPYLWLLGAILMIGWLLYINHSLHRRLKKRGNTAPESINLIFEDCKKKAGVGRSIEIIIQDAIPTPAIIGVFRPRILLSPAISDLASKDISYILLHELAHYKRKDLLANYLLLVLQIIHWFNPVIWYCFKIIRQDMEVAADERVLALLEGDETKEYGKALLAVLDSCNSPRLAPKLIGMVDDRKNIEKRIRMIRMTDFYKSKRRLVMATGTFCVVILGGVLLTNALPKQAAFEIGNNDVKVQSDWKVTESESQKQITKSAPIISSDANEEIMRKYISDFLQKGYSKYYIINSINCDFRSKIINAGKLEAIVYTTMNSNVPPKDPDTVPYLIGLKEKAQKETNPERKKILQQEYETLRSEYGKPNDGNFIFKLTANMADNKIDEKSIKLYFDATAAANSEPIYVPAEDILPK